jgi:hypothetical protein
MKRKKHQGVRNMRKTIFLVLLLVACSPQQEARMAAENRGLIPAMLRSSPEVQQEMVRMDEAECAKHGFKKGSDAFSKCLFQISENRKTRQSMQKAGNSKVDYQPKKAIECTTRHREHTSDTECW